MTLPFLSRSRLRARAGTPPVPQSPSDIALSANTIADNASSGTDVGTLSATDSDSSSFTWTIVSQPSGNPFALSGTNPAATIVLERAERAVPPADARDVPTYELDRPEQYDRAPAVIVWAMGGIFVALGLILLWAFS